jgi:ubiquitin-protein ligase
MTQEQRPQAPDEAAGQTGDENPYSLRFYIEDPAGDIYRAEALSNTLVRDVATDFFEERAWATRDQAGRPQRAVVERVDPDNPERSTRLRPDQTLHDAGVQQEDTLRVLPESVAGAVEPHERLRALVTDHREVLALRDEDPEHIKIETNADHAPTHYTIAFGYPGIRLGDDSRPQITREHRVEILLPADYPLEAPLVRWLTPIYHPNISQRGIVCLGVLAERYLPGLGLAYIVRMLRDIVRYRNYDLHGVYNREAADWARSSEGQAVIQQLDGVPEEQPLDMLLEVARQAWRNEQRQRTRFKRVDRFAQDE